MPISASDTKLRRSTNGSLGGARISTEMGSALFPALMAGQAARTEYRCVYVLNTHATLAMQGVALAVQSDSTSPSTALAVGVGTSAVGGTEQSIGVETTAPSGVTYGTSANLGDIPAGQARAIWIRRTVSAGAPALQVDAANLRVTGSYSESGTGEPETFFDSLTYTDANAVPGSSQNGLPLVLSLPGSGGSNLATGRQYRAQVSGNMAFGDFTEFAFSTLSSYRIEDGKSIPHVELRPVDQWMVNSARRESMHMGFQQPDGRVHLTSEHRYDEMMRWALVNLTQFNLKQLCVRGGSMGAWGAITFGIRRADLFAAIYSDRPRWRYGYSVNTVSVAKLDAAWTTVPVASAPLLSEGDGGGSYADHVDLISYISDPANKIPPVLWCIGRRDGYATFDDQLAAVAAMRATGRAFVFIWNDSDHGGGGAAEQLMRGYPYGTYELGRGYPLFTEHSGDQDPTVDLVGGINEGLSFRSVVESASAWSCEVTSVLGPRTVKVKPISEKFTTNVPAKTVTIPAANTWVAVSFSA